MGQGLIVVLFKLGEGTLNNFKVPKKFPITIPGGIGLYITVYTSYWAKPVTQPHTKAIDYTNIMSV